MLLRCKLEYNWEIIMKNFWTLIYFQLASFSKIFRLSLVHLSGFRLKWF
jgi:hypothetical protein